MFQKLISLFNKDDSCRDGCCSCHRCSLKQKRMGPLKNLNKQPNPETLVELSRKAKSRARSQAISLRKQAAAVEKPQWDNGLRELNWQRTF